MQGLSMPNISNASSSSPYSSRSQNLLHGQHPKQDAPEEVKLRTAKNPTTRSTNCISYDVASEMEKLWEQLHNTTVQELADFDLKFSPKLFRAGIGSANNIHSHSHQGSLDSAVPSQLTLSTNSLSPHKPTSRRGHARVLSLPIDPNSLPQLQQEVSTENTPHNLYPRRTQSGNVTGQRNVFGSAQQLNNERKSHTPPIQYGHVRQISGGSMSSESGTFSPPMVLRNLSSHIPERMGDGRGSTSSANQPSDGDRRVLGQHHHGHGKHSKPPGLPQVPTNNHPSPSPHSGSSQSPSSGMSPISSRFSPEGQRQTNGVLSRSFGGSQTHYSTNVIRRGKKNRGEVIISDLSLKHHYQQQQQMRSGRIPAPHHVKSLSSEERPWKSGRPLSYEIALRGGYGDSELGINNVPRVPPPKQLLDRRSSHELQLTNTSPLASRQQHPQQLQELHYYLGGMTTDIPPRLHKKGSRLPVTSSRLDDEHTWI